MEGCSQSEKRRLERMLKVLTQHNSSQVFTTESLSSKQGNVGHPKEVRNLKTEDSAEYDSLRDLSNDFHSILKKDLFADASIICGSDVIRAHKNVLCARSSVFEAMFTTPMQESKEDTVVIEDMDISLLRTMLDFMYSGQVKDLTLSTSCDLLYAAEKYQVKSLKRICVQYLRSHLSEAHALNILQCANLYDKQLKADVISYISEKFSVFKVSEKWKKLQSNNPVLAVEVYSSVFDKIHAKQ